MKIQNLRIPRTLFALAAAGALLLNTSQGALAQPRDASSKLKTLRLGLNAQIYDLDPARAGFAGDYSIVGMAFEGLTRIDTSGRVLPGGSQAWVSNATFTEWAFTVRPGLKYSDGSPLNAKRFEYGVLYFLDPANEGYSTQPLYVIDGAQEWADTAAALAAEEDQAKKVPLTAAVAAAAAKTRASVRALDTNDRPCESYAQSDCLKLRVTLNKPSTAVPYLMSVPQVFPVKEESRSAGKTWWKKAANWVGNGTHMLVSTDGKSRATLNANTNYWRGTAKVNISVNVQEKTASLINEYRRGKLDMLAVWGGAVSDELRASLPAAEQRDNPTNCPIVFVYRTSNKPFDDVKVRQAFSSALDRAALAGPIASGAMIPNATWLPQNMPGAIAGETRFAYNVDNARRLLAESSYKTVAALPAIQIAYIEEYPPDRPTAELLASQLRAAFPGLQVEAKPVKGDDIVPNVRDNLQTEFDMWTTSWCGDRPDDLLGDYFLTNNRGWKNARWSNAAFDELAVKMATELDDNKRAQLAGQMHNILIEAQPYAFLGHFTNRVYVKPNVVTGPAGGLDAWIGDYDRLLLDVK
jgi:oligopeptide transport system substrate-binding protein